MFAIEDSRISHAADCNTPRLVGARARVARFMVFLRRQSCLKNGFMIWRITGGKGCRLLKGPRFSGL